jgi:hypothetical protein
MGRTAPAWEDEIVTDALEQRVAAIEEQLRMETGLRAASDRDLGDLTQTVRAQHLLVQALSITQSQHTGALRRIEDTLQTHGEVLQSHGEAIETLRRDHGAKLDQIVNLLTDLIDRDDRDDRDDGE